jgi:DNA-3-methyladenine glycosylase I
MSDRSLVRCAWATSSAAMIAYHDEEWGVPCHDDRTLFEFLVLEGAQAGLSWETVLRKRDAYRRAFDDFDAARIAGYAAPDVERLLVDAGIIRNRAKIEGTVASARIWLDIMEKRSGFSHLLWDRIDGKPQQNKFNSTRQIPAATDLSLAISKELAGRGFKFVGPTIIYAFMQAVGMVNDHLITCHRHAACAKLARSAPPVAFRKSAAR